MFFFENFNVIISLILLLTMVVLFVTEIVPIEVTALSVAVLMVIFGFFQVMNFYLSFQILLHGR